VRDPIAMKGQAKPFPFERELTPNGAIVASDTDRHLAFTVRWTGSEPGAAGELAALALDRARSSAELRLALARWKLPEVEVIYADVDGVAGRQVAGLVPIRSGWDGALPAPGWTGTFEWRGWRSLDNLPHERLFKADGIAILANRNAARTGRLDELFAAARAYTVDDFKRFQYDITAWNAEQLVPLLTPLHADRNEVEASRQLLVQWDRHVAADSGAATLYVFWEEALARKLAEARIAPALVDEYVARVGVPVDALTKPSGVWFDGDLTSARDRLLLDSLAAALDRARRAPSGVHVAPTVLPPWGRLHLLTFRHPLAITQAARGRFNVGPFEQAGYSGTVLSTFPGLDVSGGATFREIADLADWDRSVATNAPGQSGAPGSTHFADLAKPWAAGEYFPLAFTDAAVQANTEAVLTLHPR
jgi:penicillin amidase